MLRLIWIKLCAILDAFTDVRYYTSVPVWKPWRDFLP